MIKKFGLELEVRKIVYNFISRNPGLSLKELSKELDVPASIINIHLIILKKIGIINERTEGRYIRFFVTKKINEEDKKNISLLKQDIPFRIVMFLLLYPNSSESKICKYLRRSPSTVSYQLDKLIEKDIIEFYPNGHEINYRIKHETNLFELFYEYRNNFLNKPTDSIDYSLNAI